MRKLLTFLDNNLVKFGVIFTSLFIVLYPKLPSIHIVHTWVYIRLEDFCIAVLGLIWLVQVIRRKARLALPLGIPIILYWLVGLASLAYCFHFIAPILPNFFPSVAALEYFRRIEYMILFFIGYSAISSRQDLKDFIRFLFIGVAVIVVYGLAQHFYPYFWKYLPVFIQKTNFCFPSFQTGNEEFAKGIPLCLPVGSRVTSTFGGHYDLAGYLLIVLPIILGTWFFVKKKIAKIGLGILFITGLITLILTSSRIAFGAYLFAVLPPLILLGKKKWILPVFLISFLCLVLFSASTINRFMQTFRITSVVVNMQGQVVGTTENGLSSDVQSQLAKGKKAIQANQVQQGVVPAGSSFITLPQKKTATNSAVVKTGLSTKEAQQLKLANGGIEISTVQGNFSVQKALVYDISVTTRLQGEWPHAIAAFLKYPFLGQGYSSLTLAVDNDYLRLLGESGILGFVTFLGIFFVLAVYLKQALPHVEDTLTRIFVYGVIGGVVGLFVNASLFDIFEASKVAEPLWIIIGVGIGAVAISQKKKVALLSPLFRLATSQGFLIAYLFLSVLGLFWNSLNNFFIGDDFVWLKWAAISTFSDISKYFTDASGFFYRPLDKVLMLLFYSVFSFEPQGYHVFILFLHFFMGLGVYILTKLLLKRKLWAFIAAVLFFLLPEHAENIFWISSMSIDMSSVFLLFGAIFVMKQGWSKSWNKWVWYGFALLFAILGLLSYELGLVMPFLVITADVFVTKKLSFKRVLLYIPFFVLDIVYMGMRIASHAFAMGGDYSYSFPHFIPNTIGNTIGYLGLFIAGEWSLSWYNILRDSSKPFALPIALVGIALFIVIGFLLIRKQFRKILKQFCIPLFALAFSLIALLPYFGLGNIAERYGYLASVGFIITLVWLISKIFQKFKGKLWVRYSFISLLTLVICGFFITGLFKASAEWEQAAIITYNTLGHFKIDYPDIPQDTKIIFINRPIKYQNAWVFPVGLPEGLWFVYGDEVPTIQDASSLSEAHQLAQGVSKPYIFSFTKEGRLQKEK